MEIEVWKDAPGFEGFYLVSDTGRVKTLYKNTHGAIYRRPGLSGDKGGQYWSVSLYRDGKCKMFKVHRLVALTFLDNPFSLPCVNHIDGNKLNNRVENLEWCTYSHNNKHAHAIGLRTSRQGRGRLTEDKVLYIREKCSDAESIKEVAKELNVKRNYIYIILRREAWAHI